MARMHVKDHAVPQFKGLGGEMSQKMPPLLEPTPFRQVGMPSGMKNGNDKKAVKQYGGKGGKR